MGMFGVITKELDEKQEQICLLGCDLRDLEKELIEVKGQVNVHQRDIDILHKLVRNLLRIV